MPVSFELDETTGSLRIRSCGEASVDDFVAQAKLLFGRQRVPRPLHIFLDLREMTPLPTAQEIRGARDSLIRLRGRVTFGCCAVLAEQDATYGMARMWSILVEEIFAAVSVFRSADEAEQWFRAVVRPGQQTSSRNG